MGKPSKPGGREDPDGSLAALIYSSLHIVDLGTQQKKIYSRGVAPLPTTKLWQCVRSGDETQGQGHVVLVAEVEQHANVETEKRDWYFHFHLMLCVCRGGHLVISLTHGW